MASLSGYSMDFLLSATFNYVPAGQFSYGPFKGGDYGEFWWRECVEENDGFLVVFRVDDDFDLYHSYTYPPNYYC